MAEEEKNPIQEENIDIPEEEQKAKSPWQIQKESWYDKVPLTLKQMDIIVGVCWALLILTFVLIFLEARGIIRLFG